jgi:hypothetical protein
MTIKTQATTIGRVLEVPLEVSLVETIDVFATVSELVGEGVTMLVGSVVGGELAETAVGSELVDTAVGSADGLSVGWFVGWFVGGLLMVVVVGCADGEAVTGLDVGCAHGRQLHNAAPAM